MDIEEIKQKWLESTDHDLIQAATIDKDSFSPEVQAIIQEEIQRRNLSIEVEQQISFLKQRAEAKKHEREKRRISYRLSQAKFFIIQLTDRKILFSMALFAIATVFASFLGNKGYRVSTTIVILGLIDLSVIILIESKNRLGRCLWGWSIKTFLILFVLAYFIRALKPHTNVAYALGTLTALWIPGLLAYWSLVCDQQYDRKTGDQELRISCPKCHRKLEGATENMVGDIGVCPKCKTEFEIKK